MTIKEYNTQIAPKIRHADVCVANLFNAIQKTTSEHDAMHQLTCLGWDDEIVTVIRTALEHYRKCVIKGIRLETLRKDAATCGTFDVDDIIFSDKLTTEEASQFVQLMRKAQGNK